LYFQAMEPRSATPYELILLPVSELPVLERVKRLSWRAFEDFVAEVYRRQGFHVEQTARGRADGGYDLVLLKEQASILVQCKHWLVYRVSVAKVRELAGAMHKVGATGGVFVTTGTFTPAARRFATGLPIELVDGETLIRWLPGAPEQPAAQVEPDVVRFTPSCPKCQKPMVRRTAGKGQNKGEQFWGCPDYPGCRGLRQAA
jgi:restriction system protein